jgi:seryl-tRNA synthetase
MKDIKETVKLEAKNACDDFKMVAMSVVKNDNWENYQQELEKSNERDNILSQFFQNEFLNTSNERIALNENMAHIQTSLFENTESKLEDLKNQIGTIMTNNNIGIIEIDAA